MIDADPATRLRDRLLGFAQFARANGYKIGLSEAHDGLRAAAQATALSRPQLKTLLRSLYCLSHDDWQRFDPLFDAYWNAPNARSSDSSSRAGGSGALDKRSPQDAARDASASPHGDRIKSETPAAGTEAAGGAYQSGASAREGIGRGDFRLLSDRQQLRQMEYLAERLAHKMRRRLKRRQKAHKRGRRLHLGRSLRASLRYGGTPLKLAFRQPRRRPPRLLLLLDVSRSMSIYSTIFLRFARGIVGAFGDADAFVYHTRLVHITSALRQRDIDKVKQKLALLSSGWSGGTRIGASLAEFNRVYGRRLINSRTVVVIVSDGLDTGAAQQLATELGVIRRRARRLVWLNPLLGRDGYRPIQAGMQAALPLIDLFAPAHDLDSLLALEPQLTRL